ncbi:MAG: hypothetical protein LC113_02200 [Acidobacteria bacterium]|nr:hypothetical protein [Acidobacteriota bacterium]
MEDTDREVRAIQQRIWMSMPEEDRFRKCGEMFELAKLFIIQRAPAGLSEKELSNFVFREMYGFEMPSVRKP